MIRKRAWLILFLLGPIFVGAFSVAGWVIYGGTTRAPGRIEYVIPAGTAERVAAGEAVPSIPAKWVLVAGDVLALRNEDGVNHQLGPFWIPAGTTLTIPLERASTFSYICTIHPSGSVGLEVLPPNSWLRTLVPTLLLGAPLGGVLVVVVCLAGRLDTA